MKPHGIRRSHQLNNILEDQESKERCEVQLTKEGWQDTTVDLQVGLSDQTQEGPWLSIPVNPWEPTQQHTHEQGKYIHLSKPKGCLLECAGVHCSQRLRRGAGERQNQESHHSHVLICVEKLLPQFLLVHALQLRECTAYLLPHCCHELLACTDY